MCGSCSHAARDEPETKPGISPRLSVFSQLTQRSRSLSQEHLSCFRNLPNPVAKRSNSRW
jgi:hypothetical protein